MSRPQQLTRAGWPEADQFSNLADMAASIFGTPVFIVTFLDEHHAVFRCNVGIACESVPLDQSVSAVVAKLPPGEILVIESEEDPRVAEHPMVVGPDGLRFYAGIAIRTAGGEAVGALAIADRRRRTGLNEGEQAQLRILGRMAGSIAEGKRIESLHDEQLQILGMAEQMSGVGTWTLDYATGKVSWSDEVYNIHGLDRASFEPGLDDAIAFYHPDDQATVRACVEAARTLGTPYEFKLRLRRADGQERVVISRAAARRDDLGELRAVFGVLQDVTDMERAAERISESETRYRLLADRANDIIVTYGADGRISYISPSIEALNGRKPERLIGRSVMSLIHPEDAPGLIESFRAFAKAPPGEAVRGVRYRAFDDKGGFRWVESRTTIIRDAAGEVAEYHDVVRDISEAKALEEQLIHARDRAEAAALAKSEFLSNMSHELRTPLTSVVGFADLLVADDGLGTDARRYANRISTASAALLELINDILDYSKLEAGAVELDQRVFDPRRLADDAASIVEQQCLTKGLVLKVAVGPEMPTLLVGDDARLRQVLLNLLSNAAKFTARGSIHLRVGGEPAGADWRLRIEVQDTGIGITHGQRDQLFERFVQADSSTTRRYGGTGLGLAISRRLIEKMGGVLDVVSEPGEGSTFWLETILPVGDALEAPNETVQHSVPSAGRVLVVDDVPSNRELISALLGAFGLTVELACDGAEALDAARGGGFDLILMDMHMPVMDGLQATERIRALDGPAGEIPIIALTANVSADQVERCLSAGMNDHLAKPIRIDALASALGVWLRPSTNESAAPAAA